MRSAFRKAWLNRKAKAKDREPVKPSAMGDLEKWSEEPHVYDILPNDSIRILVLLPGKDREPLRGRLETSPLCEKPQYSAISYTWGRPIFTDMLRLQTGILQITPSLCQALRRFRSKDKPIRLWADAICINQQTLEERNRQVGIMASIYANATEVLVWLGKASPNDALAFWMIDIMKTFFDENKTKAGQLKSASVELGFSRWMMSVISGSADCDACPCCQESFTWGQNPYLEAMDAVVELIEKSWFSRLWVSLSAEL